jgi:hypothetical protein
MFLVVFAHDPGPQCIPAKYHTSFSGLAKIYYFLKCQNFRKLRSLPAEFLKNYCLWMLKFYKIQEVFPG